jgi:carbonic anhydrase/acetyltransferase-like protein (isoleucine patch superfamily)
MLIKHLDKQPTIDASAYIAPNATVCGDVTIGPGSRIMFGACVVSEGQPIRLGENCIVMENAVLRATDQHALTIGAYCLIGPHAHLVGCSLDECVFIATGASVFHGAHLLYGSEVRVNAVVHLRTTLPAHATVPIGWIAVGDPVQMFSPDKHDEIWKVQKPLNFPEFVYGVERPSAGQSNMSQITKIRSQALSSHKHDRPAKTGGLRSEQPQATKKK